MKRKEQAPTFGMNRQEAIRNTVTIHKPSEPKIPSIKRPRLMSKMNVRIPK